jgi:hypothetical protein
MRKVSLLFVLFTLCLAIMPLTVFAQELPEPVDAGEIAVGETVEGELSADEPAFAYTLTVEDLTDITATLISDDFDCYLVLLDEDGDEIAFDDDGAGSLDSRITYSLDAGTYTLVAQSYGYRNGSVGAEGEFTLEVTQRTVNRIEYGDRVAGEITGDDELPDGYLGLAYTFTGEADDVIVSEHFSDDYDSYLILELNGSQLMYNDDGAGSLDSRIGPFTLPSDGEYTLVVRSLGGSSTGDFEVTLYSVNSVVIAFDEKIEGELTDDVRALYFQFEASIGDVLSVEVDSDVDTSLTLSDPNNYNIASDDDSGSGFNPELSEVSLSSEGTYTLIISAADDGVGAVELVVSRAEVPSLSDGPQELAFDSSTFTRTLVFEAEGDVTYRLTLDLIDGSFGSPSIDATQDGLSLGYTSSSRVQRLSYDFTPENDGEVVLRISDYSYDDIAYQITLEEIGE